MLQRINNQYFLESTLVMFDFLGFDMQVKLGSKGLIEVGKAAPNCIYEHHLLYKRTGMIQ